MSRQNFFFFEGPPAYLKNNKGANMCEGNRNLPFSVFDLYILGFFFFLPVLFLNSEILSAFGFSF